MLVQSFLRDQTDFHRIFSLLLALIIFFVLRLLFLLFICLLSQLLEDFLARNSINEDPWGLAQLVVTLIQFALYLHFDEVWVFG